MIWICEKAFHLLVQPFILQSDFTIKWETIFLLQTSLKCYLFLYILRQE